MNVLEPTPEEINASWKGALTLQKETYDDKGKIIHQGLRTPQLGAYYQVLAHWTLTKEHGIIVMPTGTGKTDTMITIMVGNQCNRILVIVPSRALRDQIGERFSSFGVLPELELLSSTAQPPKVGILEKGLKNLDEVDQYFGRYNVVVATATIFKNFSIGLLSRVNSLCSHLFLDEAHHSQAPKTWRRIQDAFKNKPTLLFTATPFRNDDQPLFGKTIYNYPLSKAQQEGYFTEIEQHPISEYNKNLSDEAIAKKAVELLESDLPDYPDHLLMARANNISRAEKIFEIYQRDHRKYNPVLVHSNISENQRKENQYKFETGESKIAVCVDMFGEGYDLPQIKIGAFHDMRRNITTALQLIGRFTRSKKNLGKAKFVYNAAEEQSSKEIFKLLGDDADWNKLIPNLTEGKNKKQEELSQFVKTFDSPEKLPLQNLRPALSLAVYRSLYQSDWKPERFKEYFQANNLIYLHNLSNKKNTLVIVAGQKVPLDWMRSPQYFNVEHHLFIVHWMKKEKLLLIHSSKTKSNYYKGLARALIGEDCQLLNGEAPYRSLLNVERLKFHGVGLQEPHGLNVSYVQRSGKNVMSGTAVTDLINRGKRVLQGTGYKDGHQINFGVTSKGRIWSFQRGNLAELIAWGREVANNISNEKIDTNNILSHVAQMRIIKKRPEVRPFSIEWPSIIYSENFLTLSIYTQEDKHFYSPNIWLQLYKPSKEGDLQFEILTEDFSVLFNLSLDKEKSYQIDQISGPTLNIDFLERKPLLQWIRENPPTFYFIDGSYLVDGNQYVKLNQNLRQFDNDKIISFDWESKSVNIKKESQGLKGSPKFNESSIQHALIQSLLIKDYNLVFNDDDQDETADIVTAKVNDLTNQIFIELYHCKFSSEPKAGCRLEDLYVVLGQAQKNIRWLDNNFIFFRQLIERERATKKKSPNFTRIEKGSLAEIEILAAKAKQDYQVLVKVIAVQPGLSKQKFLKRAEDSNEVERLFAVTEDYIKATKQGEFLILCSS